MFWIPETVERPGGMIFRLRRIIWASEVGEEDAARASQSMG